MANRLQKLPLKMDGFQFLEELHVDAAPAKVWKSLMQPGKWFRFGPVVPGRKMMFEPKVGGLWWVESPEVHMLHAVVTYIEPGKLLRLSGPLGMTHLPVSSVFIFELEAAGDGTLLRFCQRTFGYITSDRKKSMSSGWGKLLPQLKRLAEGAKDVMVEGKVAKRGRSK